MLEIIRYTEEYKNKWDDLVRHSRNGTFLFLRDYMDYHSNRFIDCSYMILKKGKLEGVIPGNLNKNSFISHEGLTFGGLISSPKLRTNDVIETFNLLNKELYKNGILEIIYKPVPLIYHSIPAQEDIYALFLNKAEKIGSQISSAIYQNRKLDFCELRKRGLRRSRRNLVQIHESHNLSAFYEILENNLIQKYNTKPVHSIQEIELLISLFPENIKLYIAEQHGIITAGVILYLTDNVVHVQYISATEIGKEIGALDMLFDKLINSDYRHIPVFDFGHSTERMGYYLNDNLVFQKEGFGGRGIVYETYKYNILL